MSMTDFDYTIHSNQTGLHPDLAKLVQKHAVHPYAKPISSRQQQVFAESAAWVTDSGLPVILDCGCGRGESSLHLAEQYPKHCVLAIDKSSKRLSHASARLPSNLRYVCADLVSFWQQLACATWSITALYCLYPNPWPKKSQVKRRWHAHPIFPIMLSLSPYCEIRSNWLIYLQEMQVAAEILGAKTCLERLQTAQPITAFERKYQIHQQTLYKLQLFAAEKT